MIVKKCFYAFLPLISLLTFFSSAWGEGQTLVFPQSCESGKSITIAAVGDVLLHRPLQNKASQLGFSSLWEEAIPFIKHVDVALANLEGPIAAGIDENGEQVSRGHEWSHEIYSSFPLFNYHPSLAQALKESGFSFVSTANNHALDRHGIGIDKTIEALNRVGLGHTGTRPKGSNESWVHYTSQGGIKIAWLACTEMTNGINDHHRQVLYCYKKSHQEWILKTIENLKTQVDAVIVLPHWGTEYESRPNATQRAFAHRVLDAGALAVIGSHPHVLQGMEKYETHDNRSTFVLYSLGNFVSNQGSPISRSTIILLLGLTKGTQGTFINGVRYIPMYMRNRTATHQIALTRLGKGSSIPHQIIGEVLPRGNALFTEQITTNPECQGRI